MKLQLFHDRMANWQWISKISLLVNLGMVACVVFLTNGLLKEKQILHILPMSVEKEYWASSTTVDQEYLKQLSLSLLTFVTNITPSNIALQHEHFLKYVASSGYGFIEQNLRADRMTVKKTQMSRSFFVDTIVSTETSVLLIGMEKRWIGRNKIGKEERRAYRFHFEVNGWQARITKLESGKPTSNNKDLEQGS